MGTAAKKVASQQARGARSSFYETLDKKDRNLEYDWTNTSRNSIASVLNLNFNKEPSAAISLTTSSAVYLYVTDVAKSGFKEATRKILKKEPPKNPSIAISEVLSTIWEGKTTEISDVDSSVFNSQKKLLYGILLEGRVD